MKCIYTSVFILMAFAANAQSQYLQRNPNILLPKDSVMAQALTLSLNDFLLAAQKPNEDNRFVYTPEKAETFILLDEVNGIEKSEQHKNDHFYKPYLTNIIRQKDSTYLVQVSYIGTSDSTAHLRASFEFIAHRAGNGFLFSSPLIRNTQHWKIYTAGNNIIHYQHSINKNKVKAFYKLTMAYDKRLKVVNKTVDYYCTGSSIELQKLVGVLYKADYNGRRESVWTSISGNRKLIVLGNNNANFEQFDAHDLFHDRLSLVVPRNKVNKPVDEGCAYLYGGSWGLSWSVIFKAFKEQVASNKNTNWMDIKDKPVYFKTEGINNSADYIVNALLVKKIETEKGFEGVWQLLNAGPYEKGNEKYYQVLEALTGISKASYNEKVWELIENEQ